jgi:hypothetical protein
MLTSMMACKHDQEPITPGPGAGQELPGNNQTDVGVPQGTAISQTIGPNGGILTTADGRVRLEIPAGAIASNTLISIQPITNHAPNGLGLAYRFSPDGTQFAKLATLTFKYQKGAVAVNDPLMLQVGYQGSDKRWLRVPGVKVDTLSQSISVPMPHFSDWTAYEIAKIEALSVDGGPAKGAPLDFGQSTELEVTGALLEPLIQTTESLTIKDVKWSVAGEGDNGQIKGDGETATYTAPGKYPPQNPVTVIAEITFKENNKKVYLLKRILIGKDYFTGTFGGTPFNWQIVSFTRTDGVMHIAGWNESPDQSLHILLNLPKSGRTQGLFPYSAGYELGTAFAEYTPAYGGYDAYLSFIYECENKVPEISPGGVTINQVDDVDGVEYVRGRLTGTILNLSGPCPSPVYRKAIQGEFRIKLTR